MANYVADGELEGVADGEAEGVADGEAEETTVPVFTNVSQR